jgi:ABC-type nitrate/sulfonate/bicarbonate transport system substrate-binding protein
MSKALDDAIEHLTTTYQSLAQAAAGYLETLDPKEINARFAKAKPDTAEYVALEHLAALMRSPKPAPEPTPAEPAAEE